MLILYVRAYVFGFVRKLTNSSMNFSGYFVELRFNCNTTIFKQTSRILMSSKSSKEETQSDGKQHYDCSKYRRTFCVEKKRKVFGGDMNELEFIKLLILWRISRGSVKVSVSIFAQIRLSSSLYPYT